LSPANPGYLAIDGRLGQRPRTDRFRAPFGDHTGERIIYRLYSCKYISAKYIGSDPLGY